MTADTTQSDDPEEVDDLDLPAHLSEEARDLIGSVLDDLDEADEEPDGFLWPALLQVAELVSTADRLDEVARASGYVATGSKGQEVLHPAVTEARQARSSAATMLTRLRPRPETRHRFTSRTGAAAAAKGWRSRRTGAPS